MNRALLLGMVATCSCTYDATFVDCTVRCTSGTGCPSGLTCGAEQLCRTSENANSTCAHDDHLVLWLVADSLTQLGDGALVPSWQNEASGNPGAQQPMVPSQPKLHTDQLSGHATIAFAMAPPTYLALVTPLADLQYTAFGVTSEWSSRLAFLGGGYEPDGSIATGVGTDWFGPGLQAPNYVLLRGEGDAGLTLETTTDNGAHVYTATRLGGQGSIWIDGAMVGIGAVPATNFSAIGSRSYEPPTVQYSTGAIAELRVYDIALDDEQRMRIEQDLRATYGTP